MRVAVAGFREGSIVNAANFAFVFSLFFGGATTLIFLSFGDDNPFILTPLVSSSVESFCCGVDIGAFGLVE